MASLHKTQIPVRARGSNKCPRHAGKEVIFVCEDCMELACSKCVSTIHRKHAVDDISEIIPRVKEKIQNFVSKAGNTYIPELNGELKNLANKISGNKNHFKQVISGIVKQNEKLKQELDKIANKLIASCRIAKSENDDILKKHKAELQSRIEELNARLLELKDALQLGTITQLYDTSKVIPNDVIISTLPSIQEMDFKPTSFLISELENLIGEVLKIPSDSRTQIRALVLDKQRTNIASGSEKGNYTDRGKQPNISSKKGSNFEKSSESYVETFITLQTFTYETSIDSICARSNSQVWVKHYKQLHLLDNTGKTYKTKKLEVFIGDFSVSPSTGDIWFCSDDDSSVRKDIGDNNSAVMFYTHSETRSICISADDNILVGIDRQIVKYTRRGQIVCKSGAEVKWLIKQVPVVRYPRRISQCPVTRNIAVVDWDLKSREGDDKRHVSILNEDLQLLCRYYGRGIKSFNPWDVCYSDTGDIYIVDFHNGSILQVSSGGKFTQTVYTDSDKYAHSLCLQTNGDIWAVFGEELINAKEIILLQKQ